MHKPEDHSSSLKLKRYIKTSRAKNIIQKAEKQLAEQHVRSINNTLDICTCRGDACMEEP